MEWTIKKPQLKALLLKETGFHQPSYLNEINEVVKQKISVESEFAKELQDLGVKLVHERKLKKKLESELEELLKSTDELTMEYAEAQQIFEDLEEKLKNVSTYSIDNIYLWFHDNFLLLSWRL